MATDNTRLSAGDGGGDLIRDLADADAVKWQAMVPSYVTGGSADAWTLAPVDLTHGLPVQPMTGVTFPVSLASVPSHAVTNTGTFPVQVSNFPSGFLAAQSGSWDVSVNNFPSSFGVTGSVAVTGTFWQATQPVSIASLPALSAGTAVIGHVIADSGSTTAVTGNVAVTGTFWQATQPVSIAAAVHVVADSGTITTVSTLTTITNVVHVDDNAGSLTVDNNGTFVVQASIAAAQTLATVTTVGTVTTITNVVHVDDNAGSLTVDNSGTFAVQATLAAETTKVIGTVNVSAGQTIAVTNTGTFAVQSSQSGTWTVQPGNTPNTTPWLANHLDPAATSGSITAADATVASTSNSISQTTYTGTPDANSSVSVTLSAHSGVTVQLSGTFNGTLSFERSVDGGTTFVPFSLEQVSVGASSTTIAISDNKAYVFRGNAGELSTVRVRCTVRSSGTCAVKIQPGFGVSQVVAKQGVPNSTSNPWPVVLTAGSALAGKVGIDQTTPGTTNAVQDIPAVSGGLLASSFLSTSAVQTTQIKGSAGQVYALEFFNVGAAAVYLRLYNQTGAPASTDGANIVWRGIVPGNTAGAGFVVRWEKGLAFSTGIGIRCTGAIADNDTTVLAANGVTGNVEYK